MTPRHLPDPQFDFFIPAIVDLKWRDQQDTMERPFFSLAKNKRLKPIEYQSNRDGVFVTVKPHPEYGMATIWDADILIWAASVICDMGNRRINDVPRTLHFQPYTLLKAIGRGTSQTQYKRLREALDRLRNTAIRTNIRAPRGKKEANFGWISEWTDLVDSETGASKGMSFTLSEWLYDGIRREGGVLSIDPLYFQITGGRERWLYRVARKHAGGAGAEGFAISMRTLFEKSGAEGDYRRFKFEITKIARANGLPGFSLSLDTGKDDDLLLRMTRRDMVSEAAGGPQPALPKPPRPAKRVAPKRPVPTFTEGPHQLPLLQRNLPEAMIQKIRKDFPGWDIYALQAEFDSWLRDDPARTPGNYASAFYGFVKQHHQKNRHLLP